MIFFASCLNVRICSLKGQRYLNNFAFFLSCGILPYYSHLAFLKKYLLQIIMLIRRDTRYKDHVKDFNSELESELLIIHRYLWVQVGFLIVVMYIS